MDSRLPCRRRRSVLLLAGALLLPGLAAVAQDPSAPPGETAIPLAFKFTPGQVRRYRMEMKADMNVNPPPGQGAGLGSLPIGMKMALATSEKVIGTRDGVGTITLSVESFQLNLDVLGMDTQITGRAGKVNYTLNGQPPPPGAQSSLNQASAQLKEAMKPVTIRRTATGATVGKIAASPGGPLAGATLGMVELPRNPVSVGESWETIQTINSSLPGGVPGANLPANMEARMTHTLKEIQTRGGKRHALIESSGSTTAAGGNVAASSQNVVGTTRFDIDAGAIVSGKYTIQMSGQATGAAGGEAASPLAGASVDGVIDVVLTPAAAVAATSKPAPRRAPARRR